MSNPTLKLGLKGDLSTTIYRDNADNDKTVFSNNSINIVKLSGTGGQDTVDVTGNVNVSTNYDISGNDVLNATTLGTGIVNSSLTSVGILTTLDVSGDLTVSGDLIITGSTTSVDTANLTVEDPLFKLANQNPGDSLDIGFYGMYNDGITKFSGLFRDATDNTFNFFTGTTIEPTTTVDTTADNGYLKGNIVIGDINALTATINMVGIGITNPTVPLDVVGDINTSTDYNINGTQVLSSTTLGSGVVNSSLTSIGTLTHTVNTTGTDYQINGTSVLNATTLGSAVANSSLTSNTGNLTNTGTMNVTTGNDYQINGISVLNATTLGSAVVNSSLTSVGILTALTVNDNMNITTGNDYQINSASVLNATTLGSSVVNSSLTSVGTLTSATVSGDLTIDTNTLKVDSSGNKVGVGIAVPTSKLHIEDDTDNQADETSQHGLKITSGASGQSLMIGYDGDDDMSYINSGKTGSATNLTLQTRGGNVGVGITNPSYEMDINGDINFTGVLYQDGVTVSAVSQFLASGDDIYNINSGNVGIGDSTPSFKLDVAGDINTTTDYNISGTQVLNATTLGTGVVSSSLTSVGTLTALTVNDNMNITTGNDYQVNSASVLNTTTLGSSVVNSSLTSVGTLTSLTLSGASTFKDMGITGFVNISNNDNSDGQLVCQPASLSGQTGLITIIGARNSSSADNVSQLEFKNYDNDITTTNIMGRLSVIVSDTTNNYGDMILSNFANGSSASETMRWTSTGDVSIANGDLDVNGTVTTTLCNSIGNLGYILLDQNTTSTLTTTDYADFKLSVDNQSTETYAMYKIILHGRFDGDGGIPFITARWFDTDGEINDTNAYRTTVNGVGTTINDVKQEEMYMINRGANSSTNWTFMGEYAMTLGATNYMNTMIGRQTMHPDDGSSQFFRNISNCLTSSATVTTRITDIGFMANNINASGPKDLSIRIYRLL